MSSGFPGHPVVLAMFSNTPLLVSVPVSRTVCVYRSVCVIHRQSVATTVCLCSPAVCVSDQLVAGLVWSVCDILQLYRLLLNAECVGGMCGLVCGVCLT